MQLVPILRQHLSEPAPTSGRVRKFDCSSIRPLASKRLYIRWEFQCDVVPGQSLPGISAFVIRPLLH